ncbi:MAG: hypothetical protein LBI20_03560 [Holosporales bacterium]|jgi:hypothetical protein|nr:hypothetical protein [Holosporales bacterium]
MFLGALARAQRTVASLDSAHGNKEQLEILHKQFSDLGRIGKYSGDPALAQIREEGGVVQEELGRLCQMHTETPTHRDILGIKQRIEDYLRRVRKLSGTSLWTSVISTLTTQVMELDFHMRDFSRGEFDEVLPSVLWTIGMEEVPDETVPQDPETRPPLGSRSRLRPRLIVGEANRLAGDLFLGGLARAQSTAASLDPDHSNTEQLEILHKQFSEVRRTGNFRGDPVLAQIWSAGGVVNAELMRLCQMHPATPTPREILGIKQSIERQLGRSRALWGTPLWTRVISPLQAKVLELDWRMRVRSREHLEAALLALIWTIGMEDHQPPEALEN